MLNLFSHYADCVIKFVVQEDFMTTRLALANLEAQQAYSVCLDYSDSEQLPLADRAVCFKWINRAYKDKFGAALPRARFEELVRLGLLTRLDTSRGGHRRYYRVNLN